MAPRVDVGDRLGAYRLEAVLGRGGMGVVYLATDERLSRNVAVKVIAPELTQDETFSARFVREARLAAAIDHPNILPIHEVGEQDGVLFLVSRYVDGSDLRDLLLREGRLDPARAVELVGQIGSALDAAHGRGIIHRDVKPANILVSHKDGKDHAYLTDFGLTKERQETTGLSVTGQVVGTLDYMAPEQLHGESLDGRADLYALGCVLYQSLTGQAPYRGTDVAVMLGHLQEPPPSLADKADPGVRALDAVVKRAMAKDRDQRFASCGELARAAEAALATPAAPGEPRAGSKRPAWQLLSAIAGAVVLVGVIVGLVATSGGSSHRQAAAQALVRPDSVALIDAGTAHVVRTAHVELGIAEARCTATADGAWVLNTESQTITSISNSGESRQLGVGVPGSDISATADRLWLANSDNTVTDVDQKNWIVGGTRPLPDLPTIGIAGGTSARGVAADARYVWASQVRSLNHGVSRIPVDRPGKAKLVDGHHGGGPIIVTSQGVWVGDYLSVPGGYPGGLTRIDPATGKTTHLRLGSLAANGIGIAADDHEVWYVAGPGSEGPGTLWKVDLETATVAGSLRLPDAPTGVAVANDSIWVSLGSAKAVLRIDPAKMTVRQRIRIGNPVTSIAASGKRVWLTVQHA